MSLKEDLIVKILEISKEGIAKSKIFESFTYVSKRQINRTLAYIVDNRMLQFTEINLQYVTTDKGLSYFKKDITKNYNLLAFINCIFRNILGNRILHPYTVYKLFSLIF